MRHIWKFGAALAVTLVAGWAIAQSAGSPLKAPAGAIEAVPGPVLQVLAPPTQRPASCAIEVCASGDQNCLQGAFATVMGCLRAGSVGSLLPNCDGCTMPAADTRVFRAHGSGYVLYGTVGGAARGSHKRLLYSIATTVDPPLLLRGE